MNGGDLFDELKKKNNPKSFLWMLVFYFICTEYMLTINLVSSSTFLKRDCIIYFV